MFEYSKWIGFDLQHPGKDVCTSPSPYIVKSFTLPQKPSKAILNICGLGDAAYYLNGKRIPDSLRPTHISNLNKTIIYNVFDITEGLNASKNRIGAILDSFRLNNGHYGFKLILGNEPKELKAGDYVFER